MFSTDAFFQDVRDLVARLESRGHHDAAVGLRRGFESLNGLTDGWALFLESIDRVRATATGFAADDVRDLEELRATAHAAVYRRGRTAGDPRADRQRRRSTVNRGLWIAQAVLALVFLFAGGLKLLLPLDQLTGQMPLPGLFLRFIAVAEVLGAIGLVLPGLLGIRPGLTPLAAIGLVIIMIGATALTLMSGDVAAAMIPVAVGLLAVLVAWGRWRVAPHRRRRP